MTTNTQTTLLANDTDIEGDTLNAIIISTTTQRNINPTIFWNIYLYP